MSIRKGQMPVNVIALVVLGVAVAMLVIGFTYAGSKKPADELKSGIESAGVECQPVCYKCCNGQNDNDIDKDAGGTCKNPICLGDDPTCNKIASCHCDCPGNDMAITASGGKDVEVEQSQYGTKVTTTPTPSPTSTKPGTSSGTVSPPSEPYEIRVTAPLPFFLALRSWKNAMGTPKH